MSTDKRDLYPLLVLGTSLCLMIIGTGSVYLLVVALKPISTEFGWPRSDLSIAYAAQYFGAGVGGIAMGFWLDRSGMAKPALLGAIMIGLGGVATSFADAAWHFWLIYGLMMGLFGRATLFSPLMANITRWFGPRRAFAVGILGSGQALAGGLWPPIFQYGIETYGWRSTSLWYGVLVLAVMVPLTVVFRRRLPEQPSAPGGKSSSSTYRTILSEPTLLIVLCSAIVGCCVAMSLPLAHMVAHVSDLGYAPARGAEMLSLALLTAALSSMVGLGALTSRFGGLGALLTFSTVQTFALGLLLVFDDLAALYVVAIIFGLGYGGILPSYPVIVREYLPGQTAGSRTAIVVFFGSLGMAIGSWLGGLAHDLTGAYGPAFAVGIGFNCFNLLVITAVFRRARGTNLQLAPA
ncbi:MAG: MFS transporter [Pseudomonadota bacterium]